MCILFLVQIMEYLRFIFLQFVASVDISTNSVIASSYYFKFVGISDLTTVNREIIIFEQSHLRRLQFCPWPYGCTNYSNPQQSQQTTPINRKSHQASRWKHTTKCPIYFALTQ